MKLNEVTLLEAGVGGSKIAQLKLAVKELQLKSKLALGFYGEHDDIVNLAASMMGQAETDQQRSNLIWAASSFKADGKGIKPVKSVAAALQSMERVAPGMFLDSREAATNAGHAFATVIELMTLAAEKGFALYSLFQVFNEMMKVMNDPKRSEYDREVARANLKSLRIIK